MTKYEEVAERVEHLIDHGTFKTGHRIPSVRRLSEEFGVSITTVLEAYRLLENRGTIAARPQSGYYVRPRVEVPVPEVSAPSSRPAAVGVDSLFMRILEDTRDSGLLPLGAAVPHPSLLPTERLNRHLAKVARELIDQSHLYDVPPGCEALRVQVAQRALMSATVLTPNDLMTTNGCLEAISLALRAICQPGDTVAIESPCYFGILQAIELLGLRVLEMPTHPITGISLDAVAFAIEHNRLAAFVVMANFNNPLGSCMPDDHKKDLVELLARHRIPLIEDDVYGDLYFGEERPRTLKSFDSEDGVVLCSSFSKDIAPSYRVGWVAPGRWFKAMMRLKMATNVATATVLQHAIADFLSTGGYDSHQRRIRRAYAQQMSWMLAGVARHFPPGTRVTQPQGGFVLWVELPGEVDTIALYHRAVSRGITFAPGPLFSARQKYRNCLRLNYAWWSDEVEGALHTLGKLI
jgi:DNA-binding transcriptional MocR family regulator